MPRLDVECVAWRPGGDIKVGGEGQPLEAAMVQRGGAARELLRHAVATVAYRGGKALRGAPESFAAFRIGDATRAPVKLVAHVGDLFDWALLMAKGTTVWKEADPLPWN